MRRTSRLATELLHLPDKPAGVETAEDLARLATELLHLPDKPAGVETAEDLARLATELLHLPDKPAGVRLRGTPDATVSISRPKYCRPGGN